MAILHPLSDFIDSNAVGDDSSPSYYYRGVCPQTGKVLKLPRTPTVEAIALGLMRQLENDNFHANEGKMYGVLLVKLPDGERRVLKAFSGLLNGYSILEGWVGPIPGRNLVAIEEARTLAELEAIKQESIACKQLLERQQYETHSREFDRQLQEHRDRSSHHKRQRQEKRQILSTTLTGEELSLALARLDAESRREGIERRQLKRQRDRILRPLAEIIEREDERMRILKQRRQELSRQLQARMQAAYTLTNFSGQSVSLDSLGGGFLPTGTGECCAPKLLHHAATRGFEPLAMAEFWWGATEGDKVRGQFFEACTQRCQPLIGFLLSGLSQKEPIARSEQAISIVYEDEWLIAIDKPAGLLSVPGRYLDRQDSVLARLRHQLPDGENLMALHRLDRDTSGVLLLARDRQTHRRLCEQFQQRQVRKVYEAILSGVPRVDRQTISLPLWADPQIRPARKVDWERGKPSLTHWRSIDTEGEFTRVEFFPITGRTHQIRVHASDPAGLGIPILGDRLYGCRAMAARLHLHARELQIAHPQSRQNLHFIAQTPF